MKTGKNAEQIPPLKSTNENGEEIYGSTDLGKANCLNNYFASISSVDDSNTNLPPFSSKIQNSLHSIHILESEIVDDTQTLKINKASGEDQISNRILLKLYL